MKLSDHSSHSVEIGIEGRLVCVDLCYPRIDENPNAVEIGLLDVRAADSILVSYDFDRDGWRIQQATCFDWEPGGEAFDRKWKEVAFIPAWGGDENAKPTLIASPRPRSNCNCLHS